VECQSNLKQVRLAIDMYRQTNEHPPASVADLSSSGVTSSILVCPISHKPYVYDPVQGEIKCVTPGHERY
jgi:hypothetical protein